MPIRFADLHTRLLRASYNTTVGAALKPLANLPDQAGWLLLIALEAGGYAVLGLDDLAQRSAGRGDRLNIQLDELNLVSSPIIDADEELEAARAQAGATGYAVVLRDGQALGILAAAPAAPATADVQQL